MKTTKILTWLLAILGFQMQSCTEEEVAPDEYGCPYTTYKTHGTVKDENGNKIQDAKVSVKIDAVVETTDSIGVQSDTIWHSKESVMSDKRGNYETRRSGEYLNNYAIYHYEVITDKDGYAPDTIRKAVEGKNLKLEDGGKWESVIRQEINIVLKKKTK